MTYFTEIQLFWAFQINHWLISFSMKLMRTQQPTNVVILYDNQNGISKCCDVISQPKQNLQMLWCYITTSQPEPNLQMFLCHIMTRTKYQNGQWYPRWLQNGRTKVSKLLIEFILFSTIMIQYWTHVDIGNGLAPMEQKLLLHVYF